MNLVARARHVLARHPSLYWIAVTALAAAGAAAVADATAAVDVARREWGADRPVLVATADVVPGEPLAGRVEAVHRPAPTVPDAALVEVPVGAVARQRIAAGEVLVEPDVASPAGPRALVPPGWLAVAVAEPVPSGAGVGDPVIAAGDGAVLASDGVVVGRHDTAVLVAVPAEDAPAVARAAADGTLALLLAP